MIVKLEDIMALPEFEDADSDHVQMILNALEVGIRKETNNNFQNRNIRFPASCEGHVINGYHRFIRIGDTLQISESEANDGLCEVTALDAEEGTVTVEQDLFPVEHNLITKITYPADVVYGVTNMMRYIGRMEKASADLSDKAGISSETISRHTVSYDSGNMQNWIAGDLSGFPADMLRFLDRYRKARF